MTVAILSVAYCNSVHGHTAQNFDVSSITFNVIHTPNFHPNPDPNSNANQINYRNDNKMAVKLEGNDRVYLLNNFNSTNNLIYTGTADVPLLSTRYKYIVVDYENNEIDSEPFYRHLEQHNNGAFTPYEFYGRHNLQLNNQDQQQYLLPQVNWQYKNVKEDYQYNQDLDRNQIHPINEIPTWHIQANPEDFGILKEKILEDIGIRANVTRISSDRLEQLQNVRIELSGQTSRLFRKLSYSIHIDKEGSINGYRHFKLRSCSTDPSYIREKLYYDILDASKLPTAKASFIRYLYIYKLLLVMKLKLPCNHRLFINQEPQGFYLVADNYKNPFLKNVLGNGKPDYKSGTLYHGNVQENPMAVGKLQSGANFGYLGPSTNDYIENSLNISPYKVQEIADGDKSNDKLAKLVSFINFIQESSSYNHSEEEHEKKLVQEWNKRFDVSLFLKQ